MTFAGNKLRLMPAWLDRMSFSFGVGDQGSSGLRREPCADFQYRVDRARRRYGWTPHWLVGCLTYLIACKVNNYDPSEIPLFTITFTSTRWLMSRPSAVWLLTAG
jgi:hypothetical protein